jgi:hypothetical protein
MPVISRAVKKLQLIFLKEIFIKEVFGLLKVGITEARRKGNKDKMK